jgi:hypothetical protein
MKILDGAAEAFKGFGAFIRLQAHSGIRLFVVLI